jgi:chaperonin GroEL
VGGGADAEIKEKKSRVEEALCAAKAAAAEGILPGGGVGFLGTLPAVRAYIATLSDDQRTGGAAVLRALEEPLRQIAANAGFDGGAAAAEVLGRPAGVGLDVMTGEYVDMLTAGIMDPARVARLAILSAASAAAALLTAGAGLINAK